MTRWCWLYYCKFHQVPCKIRIFLDRQMHLKGKKMLNIHPQYVIRLYNVQNMNCNMTMYLICNSFKLNFWLRKPNLILPIHSITYTHTQMIMYVIPRRLGTVEQLTRLDNIPANDDGFLTRSSTFLSHFSRKGSFSSSNMFQHALRSNAQ
jgi:hypothetical protein